MKNKFILGALLSTLICSYSFAKEKNHEISELVKAAFRHEFVHAEDVQWEELDLYIRATFKMGGQILSAYFNPGGDLLAVTRNISSAQLPIRLQMLLKTKYAGYWITDLFEMNIGEDSSYFVTLNDENRQIVLKSLGSAGWVVYSRPSIRQRDAD